MAIGGPSVNINSISKLSELQIEVDAKDASSWHFQYNESSYIFIGGLDYRLTEGDIVIIFSQWGEPIDLHLVRDKKTGSSKGFCFLAYEDQRSTILAVDNGNGMEILGRKLRVDHVEHFRAPRTLPQQGTKDDDKTEDSSSNGVVEYKASGAEGLGIGVYGKSKETKKSSSREAG